MEQEAELLDIPVGAQNPNDVALPTDSAERKRVLNILAQRRYRMLEIRFDTSLY